MSDSFPLPIYDGDDYTPQFDDEAEQEEDAQLIAAEGEQFRLSVTIDDFTLEERLETLPKNPGVYQFKNAAGKVIYVGKAKNLKNRVRSYFQNYRRGEGDENFAPFSREFSMSDMCQPDA